MPYLTGCSRLPSLQPEFSLAASLKVLRWRERMHLGGLLHFFVKGQNAEELTHLSLPSTGAVAAADIRR